MILLLYQKEGGVWWIREDLRGGAKERRRLDAGRAQVDNGWVFWKRSFEAQTSVSM